MFRVLFMAFFIWFILFYCSPGLADRCSGTLLPVVESLVDKWRDHHDRSIHIDPEDIHKHTRKKEKWNYNEIH